MIRIICVGKIKEQYLKDLISDYQKRINVYHKLEILELKDSNIKDESEEILKHLNDKDYNVLLDINGKKYNSIEFSELINNVFLNSYGRLTFIIGASDGVLNSVKEKCNQLVSFSDLTFPHGLFRGILLEQIYRSFKVLNGESYHK